MFQAPFTTEERNEKHRHGTLCKAYLVVLKHTLNKCVVSCKLCVCVYM